MAALTEPNAPLKREDLANEFTIVDAKATPITTTIRKGPPPDNMLFEYPVDSYSGPTLGGRPDGKDVTSGELVNGLENAAKLGARAQWFLKAVGTGKIANSVPNIAGVGKGKAYAYGVKKKLTELKRSIEYTVLSTQESAADNGTDGSLTRGIGKWIQNGAQTDQPVPAAYRPPTAQIITVASAGAFTESQLRTLLQKIWEQTGTRDSLLVPCRAAFQSVITDFTANQTQSTTSLPVRRFNHDGDSGTIKLKVDRYEGDFGSAEFLPVQFMDDTNADKQLAYFLHPENWHFRTQQNPEHEELPNNGGGKRGMIDAILGLACTNPLAEGKVVLS